MTMGTVSVRDMGRVGKEFGRLETVLERQAAVSAKATEMEDLEEVCAYCAVHGVGGPCWCVVYGLLDRERWRGV